MPVIDMSLEQSPLGGRVERAGRALGLVETGGAEVLRDAHEEVTRFVHIEARAEDRLEGLVLLVGGDGGEQLGMADLDPAFVERELHGVGKFGERQTTIKLGPGPSETPCRLGAIVLAGREVADGGIGLLGFRRIIAVVIFSDRGVEGLLIGHLANDDGHFSIGAVGFEAGPVAAFAGDDGVDLALRTQQDRLQHSAEADRGYKLVMLFPIEITAGVIPLRDEGERQRGAG